MLFHILMRVISFLLTRKDLVPWFMFSMHVTLENLQVLGRSSWNRDLLFLLVVKGLEIKIVVGVLSGLDISISVSM
jgi:hypothetical protein